jgi:pimeloyl-ACP methyl ester carboxylesterase
VGAFTAWRKRCVAIADDTIYTQKRLRAAARVMNSNEPPVPVAPDKGRDGDVCGALTPLGRIPDRISTIADGWHLAYRMPAVRGGQTIATSMLFVPRGPAPRTGFPLIVFCHDTEGWSAHLAPSVYLQNASHPKYGGHWKYCSWIAELLSAGYAVIAIDYEGLGDTTVGVPNTGHPYFNRLSEGRSATMATFATRRALGERVSGAWAAVGHSQGGRAALAAAELSAEAKQLEATLDFRGAVAASPSTGIMGKLNERWSQATQRSEVWDVDGAIPYVTLINAYGVLYLKAIITSGYDLNPLQILGDRALRFFETRMHLDIWSLLTEVSDDVMTYTYATGDGDLNPPVTYPGFRIDVALSSTFATAINENEIGQIRAPGDILILQGTNDPFTPLNWAMKLVNTMLMTGTRVRLSLHEGADHFGVLQLASARTVMRHFLRDLFAPD